ncbi:hypothetical protein BDV26DRAFT_86140 [Aspergillus bertholletiae]|uniref:Uncharacterized protein n=1 Tax=Aspergillus bertholletiae TaxID=1226010 RepID=A0A5N7BI42_9EURO|nr:hypothetical protein BDV26DRAFT_86140 [Aspergillus bertholletiae]
MAHQARSTIHLDPEHIACTGGGRIALTCRSCAGNPRSVMDCSSCQGLGFNTFICAHCNPVGAVSSPRNPTPGSSQSNSPTSLSRSSSRSMFSQNSQHQR